MRTTLLLFIMLSISLHTNAQVNKVTKRNNLSIKATTTLKLPLLKAKSGDRYREGDINKLKEVAFPKTNITITPKSYSKSSRALNVKLSNNDMIISDNGVFFKGLFNKKGIQIRKKYNEVLGVYFKAKRSKTYRIKLKFYMKYNDYCSKSMRLSVNLGGSSHLLNIKKGANHLDFLVQSDIDDTIVFYPLSSRNARCGNKYFADEDLEFKFASCEIKELQD